jgi:hypothetical protein
MVPFQVFCAQRAQAAPGTQSSSSATAGHSQPGGGIVDQGGRSQTLPNIQNYCNGTGSGSMGGVDCPCGNTLPPGSTVGCANRTGHGASLIATGNPSIVNDTLHLTASGMPDGAPIFFLEGSASSPPHVFGNGIRCIVPSVRLAKIDHSAGHASIPAPGDLPLSQQLNLHAGDNTFFQAVYRDLGGPCGSSTNATNAVLVVWGS